jgi:hypothetical protein
VFLSSHATYYCFYQRPFSHKYIVFSFAWATPPLFQQISRHIWWQKVIKRTQNSCQKNERSRGFSMRFLYYFSCSILSSKTKKGHFYGLVKPYIPSIFFSSFSSSLMG